METNRVGTAANVAEAIRRAERSKKWTAEKAAISRTSFQRKLDGGSDFTVNEVIRIAAALGISPRSLLPEEFFAGEAA